MNIFEKSTKENKSIIASITEILNDFLNIEITDDEVKDKIVNMSLSDFIELDNAIRNRDIDNIKNMFSVDSISEYAIQGRKGVESSATSRPKPDKVKPATKSTTATSTSNNKDKTDNTADSDTGSLSPAEYAKKKELSTDIDKEIDELEKIKKLAGL